MPIRVRPVGVGSVALVLALATACGESDATTRARVPAVLQTATTTAFTTTPSTVIVATTAPASTSTTRTVPLPVDPYASPGWLAAENQRPGTTAWRLVDPPEHPKTTMPDAWIEGYVDTTSAEYGDLINVFVDTPAGTFDVDAYRMGWYDGDQGRLVWSASGVQGGRQSSAVYDKSTGMTEARWNPSLTFQMTDDWPPGAYLLKLTTGGGGAHYVPLTVRHDRAAADVMFMSAVTTWQAYNPWGGCSLYQCFSPWSRQRASIVSFDRPYAASYAFGAADFPTHELPLISFIEQQGYDVAYITNVDLAERPGLPRSRNVLVSPGHDEYYSPTMRSALIDARDAGTNLAFMGANAIYRNIRFEPGVTGRPNRRFANYRYEYDPHADSRDEVTVDWRQEPLNRNEAEILGIQYACAGLHDHLQVTNSDSWFYEGVDAVDGDRVRFIVGIEFDRLAAPELTPDNLEVVAASRVMCGGHAYRQITAYHTTDSGAGVFATGTIDWGCGLDGSCEKIERSDIIRTITANVLRVFASGPAAETHPSVGNSRSYRGTG